MISSRMDQRIIIQKNAPIVQKGGARENGWTDLPAIWAEFKPISGKEILAAGGQAAQFDAQFIIRYLAGLKEKDRIKYDGATWEIVAINAFGMRNEAMRIMARRLK